MDLINDDELSSLRAKERVRVLKTASIYRALKIKIDRPRLSLCRNLPRQGRLTDLPWPEQDHAGHMAKAIFDERA